MEVFRIRPLWLGASHKGRLPVISRSQTNSVNSILRDEDMDRDEAVKLLKGGEEAEIRCQFVFSGKNDELTSRQEARERRIVGSLKPFRWNPAGNQSRPVEPDQQPEASLAWWVGNHPCEA